MELELLADILSFEDLGTTIPQKKKPGSWKCECGLFARFIGDRHYYNGTWDCYNYTVDCKRCGEVTVECV